MELKNRIAVVTGAAGGIGRGLAERFAAEGARVVVADIDGAQADAVAAGIGGTGMAVDVQQESQIAALIETVEAEIGPIDLFCSNAGILSIGGADVPDAEWQRIWEINVMSQVWAARHLVPRMLARGGGYMINTASAAGLLNQIGAAPYAVTKHASVGFTEWLAITYGDQGLKVSLLAPQAVRSAMTAGHEESVAAIDGMLEPADVAQACVEAIRDERFLILPHPKVADYIKMKTADYERWIGGMRKLNRQYGGAL
jgi:NAD(P)-dependent dehydrogenase (short-subunit alcohol dehydrogenase family)